MVRLLIHSPQYLPNLSSMIRSAEFYGWTDIYIYDKYDLLKEPISKKERANRAHMGRVWTAGALEYINFHIVKDDVAFLTEHTSRIVGLILDPTAHKLSDFNFEDGDLVLVGNERDGLPDRVVDILTDKIYIPQKGNTSCLNVAVTFGIVLQKVVS